MKADVIKMSDDFTRSDRTMQKSVDELVLNLATIRIESELSKDREQDQKQNNEEEANTRQVDEDKVHDNKDSSTDSEDKTDEDTKDQDEEELVERGPMPLSARHKKRSQPYFPPATEAIDIPGTSPITVNSSRVVAKDLMMGGTIAINETVPEARSFSPDSTSASSNNNNCRSRSSLLQSGGGWVPGPTGLVTVMTMLQNITIPAYPVVDSVSVSPAREDAIQIHFPYTTVVDVESNRDLPDIESLLQTRRRNRPSPNTAWNTTRSNPSPSSPSGSSDCSSEPLTPPSNVGDDLQFPSDLANLVLDYDVPRSPRSYPAEAQATSLLAIMFAAPPLAEESQVFLKLNPDDITEAYSTVSAMPKEVLSSQDDQGDTQLHIAVANYNLNFIFAIVHMMHVLSLTVDTRNRNGQTALSMAVSEGYPDVVELLLIYGANMIKVDMLDCLGGNVLHFLASNGEKRLDVAKELCKFDVRFAINEIDGHGQTPLHRAVYWHCDRMNSIPIIQLFIGKGAQIKQNPNNAVTPLHLAACKCSAEITELLCRSFFSNIASEINRPGPQGDTPLDIVCSLPNVNQRDRDKVIRTLQRYGACRTRRASSPPPLEEVLDMLSSG